MPSRVAKWWRELDQASRAMDVDPMLLAAIMDRESLGGTVLQPPGPGGMGDNGNGLGLMQIDRRYHKSFAGTQLPSGAYAWTDPLENLKYGARVLKANLRLFGGVEAPAVASYNASSRRVSAVISALKQPASADEILAAVDACTTGGNYASDVLSRREKFRTPA